MLDNRESLIVSLSCMSFLSGDSRTHKLPFVYYQSLGWIYSQKLMAWGKWLRDCKLQNQNGFEILERGKTNICKWAYCLQESKRAKWTNNHPIKPVWEEIPQQPWLLIVKMYTKRLTFYSGKFLYCHILVSIKSTHSKRLHRLILEWSPLSLFLLKIEFYHPGGFHEAVRYRTTGMALESDIYSMNMYWVAAVCQALGIQQWMKVRSPYPSRFVILALVPTGCMSLSKSLNRRVLAHGHRSEILDFGCRMNGKPRAWYLSGF